MVKVSGFLAAAAIAVSSGCSVVTPAVAHSWYDPWCCNGGDCGPAKVTGWVASGPAEPPKAVYQNHVAQASPGKETRYLSSKDGKLHACIFAGQLRCVYLPPGN